MKLDGLREDRLVTDTPPRREALGERLRAAILKGSAANGHYPKDVLARGGVITPADWESAATGPGETDLASLGRGDPGSLRTRVRARPVVTGISLRGRTEASGGGPPVIFHWLHGRQASVRGDRDGSRLDILRRLAECIDAC